MARENASFGEGHNRERTALSGIRPQIQDLRTENIAALALRAREIGDVIPLWYGEGDMVTPAFIRDAAKAALDDGNTFYIPNMRGMEALNTALADYQTALHDRRIGIERTTVAPSICMRKTLGACRATSTAPM